MSFGDPLFRDYTQDGRDIVGPSGARHDGFTSTAEVLPFLREAFTKTRPGVFEQLRASYPTPADAALAIARSMVWKQKDATPEGEARVADLLHVWVAASALRVTWERVRP